MWVYRNPVTIVFGTGGLAELPRLLAGRRHALVTYPDAMFESLRERLATLGAAPVMVIDDVAPNPDTILLAAQAERFARAVPAPEVIVALGGGSVIDTAKVLAVAGGDFAAVARYLETGQGGETLGTTPIIAVPTTAGTGSEVTSWSTVWDVAAGKKHSLALPGLYPEVALIDPELMLEKSARTDHRDGPRRPLARARKLVEQERQPDLDDLRGERGARDPGRAAGVGR